MVIFNPIFWKKAQGQKQPWRWTIATPELPREVILNPWFKMCNHSINIPVIAVTITMKLDSNIIITKEDKTKAFNIRTAHTPKTFL